MGEHTGLPPSPDDLVLLFFVAQNQLTTLKSEGFLDIIQGYHAAPIRLGTEARVALYPEPAQLFVPITRPVEGAGHRTEGMGGFASSHEFVFEPKDVDRNSYKISEPIFKDENWISNHARHEHPQKALDRVRTRFETPDAFTTVESIRLWTDSIHDQNLFRERFQLPADCRWCKLPDIQAMMKECAYYNLQRDNPFLMTRVFRLRLAAAPQQHS
jgi:hypothetical protein